MVSKLYFRVVNTIINYNTDVIVAEEQSVYRTGSECGDQLFAVGQV